jgi:hypothetical protein
MSAAVTRISDFPQNIINANHFTANMMLVMMMMIMIIIIITDRTPHNNRPNVLILDKTVKKAYLIDVAIPNSHNLHSTITERFQS